MRNSFSCLIYIIANIATRLLLLLCFAVLRAATFIVGSFKSVVSGRRLEVEERIGGRLIEPTC